MINAEQQPALEYNAAGGLLKTYFKEDFRHLGEQLIKAGFGKVCVLPFRAIAREGGIEALRQSPLEIVHIEEAWNPTDEENIIAGVAAAFFHKKRLMNVLTGKEEASPTQIWDGLFPAKRTCDRLFEELMAAFPKAKFIAHDITTRYESNRWLLEINPGIDMEPAAILEEARGKGVGLVFDPSHLLPSESTVSLPKQGTKAPRGEWERQFRFFQHGLEVVDINGKIEELLGQGGALRELAQAAKETPNIRYLRVEIKIPPTQQIPVVSRFHNGGFSFLNDVGQALRES